MVGPQKIDLAVVVKGVVKWIDPCGMTYAYIAEISVCPLFYAISFVDVEIE